MVYDHFAYISGHRKQILNAIDIKELKCLHVILLDTVQYNLLSNRILQKVTEGAKSSY